MRNKQSEEDLSVELDNESVQRTSHSNWVSGSRKGVNDNSALATKSVNSRLLSWEMLSSVHPTLVCLAIVGTGVVLRLALLGEKSLWLDEMWSIAIARLPYHPFFWTIRNVEANQILYHVLLHFWMYLGSSEFAIRSLSVTWGAGTVLAVYALGRQLFDDGTAAIASMLLAVNAFHIQWSQEARGYTLVVLLVTLSSYFFVLSLKFPTRRNWSFYIATSVLSIYAHLFGVLVLASQAFSLIFLRRRQHPWMPPLVSAGVIGILTTPLAVLIYRRASNPYVPFSWVPKPTLHGIYDLFYSLAGNADFPTSRGGKSILVVCFAMCLLALMPLVKSWHRHSWELWCVGLLVSWLFVPLALILLISVFQPMMVNRYLLICVPAVSLLVARGIQMVRLPWLRLATFMIILGLASLRIASYYQHRVAFQEWKVVTNRVLTEARPGDGVMFCVAPGRLLFEYYRAHYYGTRQIDFDTIYPTFNGGANDLNQLAYLPFLSDDLLHSLSLHYSRVWLVLYHDHFLVTQAARDRIQASLSNSYLSSEESRIDGVTVILYKNARRYSIEGQ